MTHPAKPISQLRRTPCAAPQAHPAQMPLRALPGLPTPASRPQAAGDPRARPQNEPAPPETARDPLPAPPAAGLPAASPPAPRPPPQVAESNQKRSPRTSDNQHTEDRQSNFSRSTAHPASQTGDEPHPTPSQRRSDGRTSSAPTEQGQRRAPVTGRVPLGGSGGSSPRKSTASHRRGG
jgi:hypothetical protein